MTTLEVKLNLPDELARQAQQAGLLTTQAIESMLRERLRRQAGPDLRSMWVAAPQEELTPEAEQEIVEAVYAIRAQRRKPTPG